MRRVIWALLPLLLADAGPAAASCAGDCSGDETVSIAELVTCVQRGGDFSASIGCAACDADADGSVGIDDLIAATAASVGGCMRRPPTASPTPTPSRAHRGTPARLTPGKPTPTAPPSRGCVPGGSPPCLVRAPATVGPCAAVPLPGNQVTASTVGGSNLLGNGEELSCGNNGGGRDAPERVYIFTPPAPGRYEIAVQGDKFRPLLHLRRQSCQGAFLACADDPTTARRPRLTVDVVAPIAPIAIGIDGDGATQRGGFTLTVTPRLPDLVALPVVTDGGTTNVVGGPANVAVISIANSGDLDAGTFLVEAQFFRDQALTQPLGAGPATCRLSGLAAGATGECNPDIPLTVPSVSPGPSFLGIKVDTLREVREIGDGADGQNGINNQFADATSIASRGALLEQEVFRANDGTTYQVVRVLPSAEVTAADFYRLTSFGGAAGGMQACSSSDGFPGGEARAFVGLPPIAMPAIRRTGIVDANDLPLRFDPTGRGTLRLGSGATAAVVCRSCPDASAAALTAVGSATDGIPASCLVGSVGQADCDGQPLVGGVRGFCAPGVTTATEVCREQPEDGVVLQPGRSLVFVHDSVRGPFTVAAGGFGVTLDALGPNGCTTNQIVDAFAVDATNGRVPVLEFADSATRRRTDFSDVVASADGRDVYVTDASGRVLQYVNDPAETFRLLREVREGAGGVGGLTGASALALSPDGRHLYVTSGCRIFCSGSDDAVVVLARDLSTGHLTYVQTLRDGVAGVDGLAQAGAVAVSPDGTNVYVAGTADDAIAIFTRDPATGRLTFVGPLRADGSNSVPAGHLTGPRAIALSSDGTGVYVAATPIGGGSGRVVAFTRQPQNAKLLYAGTFSASFFPRSIAIPPGDAQVYIASGVDGTPSPTPPTGEGVWTCARNPTTAVLSNCTAATALGTSRLRSVELSRDGTRLEVVSAPLVSPQFNTVVVTSFTRNPTTGALTRIGSGSAPLAGIVDNTAFAFALALSPSATRGYLVGGTSNRGELARLSRTAGGVLEVLEVVPAVADGPAGLVGAQAIAVHGTGIMERIYVGSRTDAAIVVFGREAGIDELAPPGLRPFGSLAVGGPVSSLAVTPDGAQLYAMVDTEIRRYGLEAGSAGSGLPVAQDATALNAAGFALALSPTGAQLYAATSAGVRVFNRAATTGALSLLQTVTEIPAKNALPATPITARSLAVSPDGSIIYVGDDGHRLVRLQRNAGTGLFAADASTDLFVTADEAFIGTAPLAFSPDGTTLYAVLGSFDTGRVTTATGGGVFDSGADGLGFRGAKAVAVSPDGAFVFVTGGDVLGFGDGGDDAVAAFARDPANGLLTPLEQQRNGIGRIQGLDGPAAIAVSPDGSRVYVASDVDNALAAFVVKR